MCLNDTEHTDFNIVHLLVYYGIKVMPAEDGGTVINIHIYYIYIQYSLFSSFVGLLLYL